MGYLEHTEVGWAESFVCFGCFAEFNTCEAAKKHRLMCKERDFV